MKTSPCHSTLKASLAHNSGAPVFRFNMKLCLFSNSTPLIRKPHTSQADISQVAIATSHLLPKQRKLHALEAGLEDSAYLGSAAETSCRRMCMSLKSTMTKDIALTGQGRQPDSRPPHTRGGSEQFAVTFPCTITYSKALRYSLIPKIRPLSYPEHRSPRPESPKSAKSEGKPKTITHHFLQPLNPERQAQEP